MRAQLQGGSVRTALFLTTDQSNWLKEEAHYRDRQSRAQRGHAVSASALVRNALDFYRAHPAIVDNFVAMMGNAHMEIGV